MGAGVCIIKRLLGDTIWELAYPGAGTMVSADAPTTQQARQLLAFTLERRKTKMLEDQRCQTNAKRQADAVLEKVSTYKACRRHTAPALGCAIGVTVHLRERSYLEACRVGEAKKPGLAGLGNGPSVAGAVVLLLNDLIPALPLWRFPEDNGLEAYGRETEHGI